MEFTHSRAYKQDLSPFVFVLTVRILKFNAEVVIDLKIESVFIFKSWRLLRSDPAAISVTLSKKIIIRDAELWVHTNDQSRFVLPEN